MSAGRVVATMSGGVDSSVTAALLKERGFEVIGITMQIQERSEDWGGCCGLSSIEDAKKAADMLGIPHLVLNFRDIFMERVIANFCKEYREGRTPNPCIRCNQYIKFGALVKRARELGADYVATGHYARIEKREFRVGSSKSGKKNKPRYALRKGVDAKKDQSYVLYTMTQEQLEHTLMPLGEFTKDEVRGIAKEKDLPAADRPESQEICFIQNETYGEFLKKYIPEGARPGPIVNKEGKVIGEHRGIIFYTIGQRRGIGIAAGEPLYVIAIDKERNSIVVGKEEDVYGDELIANDVNYTAVERLKEPVKMDAKIRYLHQASSALVSPLNEDRVKVKFDEPQWAVTPGQAVVFYDGDNVAGGGTILTRILMPQ
jgi:tRNA-specific 2-thiouridylase